MEGGKTRRGVRNQKARFLRVRCVSGGGGVNAGTFTNSVGNPGS